MRAGHLILYALPLGTIFALPTPTNRALHRAKPAIGCVEREVSHVLGQSANRQIGSRVLDDSGDVAFPTFDGPVSVRNPGDLVLSRALVDGTGHSHTAEGLTSQDSCSQEVDGTLFEYRFDKGEVALKPASTTLTEVEGIASKQAYYQVGTKLDFARRILSKRHSNKNKDKENNNEEDPDEPNEDEMDENPKHHSKHPNLEDAEETDGSDSDESSPNIKAMDTSNEPTSGEEDAQVGTTKPESYRGKNAGSKGHASSSTQSSKSTTDDSRNSEDFSSQSLDDGSSTASKSTKSSKSSKQQDKCTILLNFYNEMGGSGWINQDGWFEAAMKAASDGGDNSPFDPGNFGGGGPDIVPPANAASEGDGTNNADAEATVATVAGLGAPPGILASSDGASSPTEAAAAGRPSGYPSQHESEVSKRWSLLRRKKDPVQDSQQATVQGVESQYKNNDPLSTYGPDCCTWFGVSCDPSTSEIQYLDLASNGLSGELSQQLFALTELRRLNVSSNAISGQIPDGFDELSELRSVYLAQANVTGPIPFSLQSSPRLQNLNLGGNDLTGDVAMDTPMLINVALDGNRLSSIGFTDLQKMTQLQRLDISGNAMRGSLPDVSGVGGLLTFDASDNDFTGPLFDITHMSNLTSFSVRNNSLTGNFPSTLGRLTHLTNLQLGSNRLSGIFPQEQAPPNLQNCRALPNPMQGCPPQSILGDSSSLAFRCHVTCTPGGVVGGITYDGSSQSIPALPLDQSVLSVAARKRVVEEVAPVEVVPVSENGATSVGGRAPSSAGSSSGSSSGGSKGGGSSGGSKGGGSSGSGSSSSTSGTTGSGVVGNGSGGKFSAGLPELKRGSVAMVALAVGAVMGTLTP